MIFNDRTSKFLKYLEFLERTNVPFDGETSEYMAAIDEAWLLYAHHDPRDFIELEVITDEDYALQDR